MAVIDSKAREPLEELIDRAAMQVMLNAVRMLGGPKFCSKKNVLVIAGNGNNGADGLRAADFLNERGIRTKVVDAFTKGGVKQADFKKADLIIDAALGTGLNRPYAAPPQPETPVLAVDIPSGVDGLTGQIEGSALKAERTVSFAALKPGHLLYPGSSCVGRLIISDIGLDVSSAKTWLLTEQAIAEILKSRPPNAHKWQAACWVVGGSPGMGGSVALAAGAALRSGSGYVRTSTPGADFEHLPSAPKEAVAVKLDEQWADQVLSDSKRFKSLILGPGLGDVDHGQFKKLVSELEIPLVVDGDGLNILSHIGPEILKSRKAPVVLTPHDKEFERLYGQPVSPDRLSSVRELAKKYNAVILLKGPTTLVANPKEDFIFVSNTGDERLATAGTGDVLAGIIGAFLAMGISPPQAAAGGAYVHGRACELGPKVGLMAGDLLDLLLPAFQKLSNPELTGKV